MSLFSLFGWVKAAKRKSGVSRQNPRWRQHLPRPRFVPRLEALEGRLAPAVLTVRVTVEAAAENRSLQIAAESPTFYRSSEVQIDGANAHPMNVFEFRDLPLP